MALTVTRRLPNAQPDSIGGYTWLTVADVLFDNSYAAGGESLTPGDLGFQPGVKIVLLTAEPAGGFTFQYDRAASKLKVLCPGVVTGAAGALTLDDFPMSGVGATPASVGLSAGNATTRFGGQVEVANAVDLSTITTRVVAIGAVVA